MSSKHIKSIFSALLIMSILGVAWPIQPVLAETYTVDTLSDFGDVNIGDGTCATNFGDCSLRAAIQEANHHSGPDTILFKEAYTITLQSALPALEDTYGGTTIKRVGLYVSINGTNAGTGVDGLVLNSSDNKIQNLNIYNFSGHGIKVVGDDNIIGMDSDGSNDAQEYNQIHSNGLSGIYVSGNRNRISGNYIGIKDKPNQQYGIEVAGGSNTLIGTNGDEISVSIEGNTIAYNTMDGIFDHGSTSVIAGNTVINNGGDGIFISLSGLVRVGTDGNGTSDIWEGNLISGNHKNGIRVYDSDNVTISGNKIGVNSSYSGAYRNYDYGIYLQESNSALIGSDGKSVGAANQGNLISGNTEGQIFVQYGLNVTIAGNKIGTDISGTAALSTSQGFGIKLQNSETFSTSISTIKENLISGLGWYGIMLYYSDSNTIKDNIIGLDASGLKALPNEANGVEIITSDQNFIDNNVISGNESNGIFFNGAFSNRVRGNLIGTNLHGTAAVGNGLNGILLQGSSNNTIGTDASGGLSDPESNLISGNLSNGVKFNAPGPEMKLNNLYSNRIGTTADGNGALPNGVHGILMTGPLINSNTIQNNLIANHNYVAVRLEGVQPTNGNNITKNSMIANYGGISLQGAEGNDYQDFDYGPNDLQNYPEITLAEYDGAEIGVALTLNSKPSRLFSIHFYLARSCTTTSQSDYNQGETYLGFTQVETDENGNVIIGSAAVPISSADLFKGPYLLATATHPDGSTSEFSNCFKVDGLYFYNFLPLILR